MNLVPVKRIEIKKVLKEILTEDGNVSSSVGGYLTPKAFSKSGQKKNVATKTAEHLGMKTVKNI